MNIFYLNSDPYIAAEKQYNKHVVKMILESAQLLCSAHHMLGSEIDVPYKLTQKTIRVLCGPDNLNKTMLGYTFTC